MVLAIIDYRRPDMARGASIEFLAFNAGLTKERFLERVIDLEVRCLIRREGPDGAAKFQLTGLEEEIIAKTRQQ